MSKEKEKLIEEMAVKYVANCLGVPTKQLKTIKNDRMYFAFIAGYKKGAYDQYVKLENLNRWRKIEDELPDNEVRVLLKSDSNEVYVGYYYKQANRFWSDDETIQFLDGDIIKWKNID